MPDSLPVETTDLLRARSLVCVDVLVASQRKRQYTLLVEDPDRRRWVLKYRDPSQGPLGESSFYERHRAPYLPDLVEIAPDHVLMRYHEGRRLREKLSRGPLEEAARRALIDALSDPPLADEAGVAGFGDVRRSLVRNLMRLLTSGPMDTPAPGPISGRLLGWRARLLVAVVGGRLSAGAAASAATGPPVHQHGDLHLNNVILGEGGRVIILDWEDTFIGTPICDWLYFWPQYLRLAGPDDAFGKFREEATRRWPAQTRIFDELLPLFAWAARSNPRFGAVLPGDGSKHGAPALS